MKKLFLFTLVCILLVPFSAYAQVELSSFETRYGDYGRYRGRAHNIRRTATILSSTTLQPNAQFSFNGAVGQRTRANGFRRAPVIISGRMERGYGGGVCQTASTIHAAALYAGLSIVRHYPHSRISGYIRPGLDATVDWDSNKDLVIQNPYSFPVTMTVSTRAGRSPAEEIIRVTFSAPRAVPGVTVRLFRRILEQFNTIEEADPRLNPGQRRVAEPGTPRVYVVVRRIFQTTEGFPERPRERRALIYESSSRVIRYGPTE